MRQKLKLFDCLKWLLFCSGCYASHVPASDSDAAIVHDGGFCLIDYPCWCHSMDDGTAMCFENQASCDWPDCEYRWGSGPVTPP